MKINVRCWIDGDGTRIYFYEDNGTWKDENGLSLEEIGMVLIFELFS